MLGVRKTASPLAQQNSTLPSGAANSSSFQDSVPGSTEPSVRPTLPKSVAGDKPKSRLEEISVLGAGGIFCLILAAIYLVKLAVDAGWLTPVRQVALAVALGIGLIISGFRLAREDDDHEYLSYLPAAGIVVLYVAFLGGSIVHHLYSPMAALLLVAGTALATILIYERVRMFAYLMLSKIGSYLTPLAFASTVSTELIQVYYLVVSVAYTVIAVVLNARPIAVLAAYFALFMTSVFSIQDKTHYREGALYLACQALIFFGGTLYHTFLTRKPMSAKESLKYFPLVLFFYFLEYALVNKIYPDLAPFISIGFAAFLLGVYALSKAALPKDTELASEDVLMSSAFVVLTHSLYFVLLPENYQPLTFMVILGIGAYFYNQVYWPKSWELFRKILMVIGGGLLVWNYALVLFSVLNRDDSLWTVSGFFMSGGLLALLQTSNLFRKQNEDMPWLLYAPHVMVAASLYGLLKEYGSFAVSTGWAVYALGILGYGLYRKDRQMARSSMVVLILSSLKVFFYDLSGANTGSRILSLLVTGALLYTAGWVFRKV